MVGAVDRPGKQGAIHGKVLIAEQRLDVGGVYQFLEETPHDVVVKGPLRF
jgi:hypothetical protein